mgnify:CR=1 FL=1
MQVNNAKQLGPTGGMVTDAIKSLDADGFTLGTHTGANGDGYDYYWVAFKAGAGELKVDSYVGDGNATQSITVGFQPAWVVVMEEAVARARHQSASMTDTAYFSGKINDGSAITALTADGFQVNDTQDADGNRHNRAGITYHYFAFKKVSGKMNEGTYDGVDTGDDADDRNITGVGFQTEYVIVKNATSDDNTRAVGRPASRSAAPAST